VKVGSFPAPGCAADPKAEDAGVPPRRVGALPPEGRPGHVAFIMDGNGRWALQRGLQRSAGHRAGAEAAERAVRACLDLAIPHATFFALSTENWRRSDIEIGNLLELLRERLGAARERLPEGVRIRFLGDHLRLDRALRRRMQELVRHTASASSLQVNIAIGYGGRADIAAAARELAGRAVRGEIAADEIDEAKFAAALATRGLPDPDLIIRTGGECRLSNFLLWQSAYAEFVSLPDHWPDFDADMLAEALRVYAGRERRFGGSSSW